MTVLITGAGLIGSQVARLLSARGQPCLLMDLHPPPAAVLALPGVGFLQGDVSDSQALDSVFAEPVSAVVHSAAMLSTGLRANPLRGLEVNLMGTVRLLDAAQRARVSRFVQTSSATVVYAGFDTLGPGPIPEDATLRLITQRPGSLYALSKLTNEHLALIWRDHYGLSTVSLRLAAVAGGDTDPPSSVPGRLIARLIAAARRGGQHLLDDPFLIWAGREEFIDPRDCARAILAALDAADPAQGVYAIAHPQGWTLPDLAAAVADRFGPFTLDLAEPPATGFAGFRHVRPAASDLSAAAAELGFRAEHDLTDTLAHWWPLERSPA